MGLRVRGGSTAGNNRGVREIVRELADEEMTGAFAAGLADVLRAGDVVLMEGEMGAGKTTFVRGVAARLGVAASLVSSPTFVIVNAYPVPAGAGALGGGRLVHADAYRVRGGVEELENAGWDRLIDPRTGRAIGVAAAFVEWPSRVEGAVSGEVVLRLEVTGEGSRRVTLRVPEEWAGREGFAWLAEREPTRCRKTGIPVRPTSPTWPFVNERARDADLFGWLSESYRTTREPERDEDQEIS